MWPADYNCLRHACCLLHFLIYQGRSARIDPGAGTRQTTGQIFFFPFLNNPMVGYPGVK